MAQNCVKHEKWDYQCMITNHCWLQTVAASEGRTSNVRSKKEVRKSAIYALKKNKSQRWRPQRSRSAKKKRGGKSVGGTGALMRCLSYSRGETAETSCLSVWTQGCLPIAALNYGQVPRIYRKHPPTGEKKKHYLQCLLLPLFTAKYMSLWWQRREKNNADCYTTSREQSPAIFSRMRALNESTGLRSSTRPQHNGSFQCVAYAQMKPHSDMLWAGPQFQAPRGAASRGLGIAKANKVPDEALRQDVSPGLQKFHPAATRNPRKWLTTVPKNNTFLQIISRQRPKNWL